MIMARINNFYIINIGYLAFIGKRLSLAILILEEFELMHLSKSLQLM